APLPDRIDGSLDPVLEAFYRVYHDVYGYVDREAPVEIVDLRMQVVGVTPKPASLAAPPAAGERAAATATARSVYWNGTMVEAAVYQRAALQAGDRLTGPALIEQDDTTTIVPAGFSAAVDAQLNVIMERRAR
ncbi:MAG TPA: hydantoinase/oxoprolinase family protein, partial [bacterium]|nr:hydantoinase/oxoprolinase family protein [bacterium]